MRKYLLIFFIVIAACSKDEEPIPETIYPLPYLPVYPGSSWTYIKSNGDTVIHTTSASYQLHQYNSENLGGYLTDPVYVPYWNGKPVYGYSSPIDNQTPAFEHYGCEQVGYLSENQGDGWAIYSSQYSIRWRSVSNIDMSIVANSIQYNHTIVVKEYYHPYQTGAGNILTHASYYAKNIGLVREEYFNKDSVTSFMDLISYHINK